MSQESTIRPWYRIHWSTLSVLAGVLAFLVFINIPGDRGPHWPYRYSHGWPYVYFERSGGPDAYWTYAGKFTELHQPELIGNVLASICIVMLVACPCELWIRRNGRLFRFGIRSMFFATTLVAVILGLSVREVHRCYRQQRALADLAQFGSIATFRSFREYDWLRSFFGEYAHGSITVVRFTATRPIDRLPDLRALADVEEMEVEMLNVPDNVEVLGALPKLEDLTVRLRTNGDIERKNVATLSELPQLGLLWLSGEACRSSTITAISRRSRIEVLRLDSSSITEAALERLTQIQSLAHVSLHESELQKADALLLRLSSLKSISFFGISLSPQDEQRVGSLWPDREIKAGTYADTGENFVYAIRP
jgi:hypothetical protein